MAKLNQWPYLQELGHAGSLPYNCKTFHGLSDFNLQMTTYSSVHPILAAAWQVIKRIVLNNAMTRLLMYQDPTLGQVGLQFRSMSTFGQVFSLAPDELQSPKIIAQKAAAPNSSSPITSASAGSTTIGTPAENEQITSTLYIPPQITSFVTDKGIMELGQSVSEVILTWTINKPVTSQSINQGIGSLATGLRTYQANISFSTDRTFTLTVSDGTTQVMANAAVNFQLRRFWGVSNNTVLTNADILALNSEFAGNTTSGNRSKAITYDCTGGRYPYLCYPSAWGLPANVTINGLAFSDFLVTVQTVTNTSGGVASYNVIRLNNLQNGASLSINWN
jgi:hypothetical protein